MDKISLCNKCKDNKGVVSCDSYQCKCDCHYELDNLILDFADGSD